MSLSNYEVRPRYCNFGKIVGGGFPIGVMAGRKEIMEMSNTRIVLENQKGHTLVEVHFCKSSINVTGFNLRYPQEKQKHYIQKSIIWEKIPEPNLTKIFDGRIKVTGKGSLFMTHFLKDGISEINNSSDVAKCDSSLLHKYHFDMMVKDGIFFLPGKLGAISNAHSQNDLNSA